MEAQSADIKVYLKILKTRKLYFIIPSLVVVLAFTAAAVWLPSVYESKATILIEEQQIPSEFVRSTVTGFADQRIQSLTQQILSRNQLREVVTKFNLYPKLQQQMSADAIVDKIRKDIKIETLSAEMMAEQTSGRSQPRRGGSPASAMTIAFSISYEGNLKSEVQKVTRTLTSLYMEENTRIREAQAKTTTQFLEAELKALQERIRELGGKISGFKQNYEGMLPEDQQFNQGQVERLESEIKQIDTNIRSTEDKKTILEGQLATVNPNIQSTGGPTEQTLDPAARLRSLQLTLADLRAKFSDEHPDVRKIKREMAEVQKILRTTPPGTSPKSQKLAQLRAELAEKQGKYSDQHPDIRKLKSEIEKLEKTPEVPGVPATPAPIPGANPAFASIGGQIQAAAAELVSLKAQRQALQDRLQAFRKRLEEAPKVEQQYLALQRDYKNATDKHQEVMNKILEARIAEGMEERQKGEKFTLIDPASPARRIKPKRLLIFTAGLVFALISGLGSVALVEVMDHSVKTPDALAALTGLPVLGSIPRITTSEDVVQEQRRRKLILGITIFSILLVLAMFHFFYMNLGALMSHLMHHGG